MAFLKPQFMFDGFVSYSHGDPDGDGDSPLQHWTSEFVRVLRKTIRSIEPELQDIEIWFDAHIDPTKHLTEELRHKVQSAAVLMVVMSPAYLYSTWCTEELKWFQEQISSRRRDEGRIFVVHALPTNRAKWPAFLQDDLGNALVGFQFYEPQTGMPFGWGFEDISKSGKEFNQRLWTLQNALVKRLRELQEAAPKPERPIIVPGRRQRVYLHARPEPEYVGLRDKVRRDLEQDGLHPVPSVPSAPPGPVLHDWVREGKRRFEDAKRCEALALVRADDDENFIQDLYQIAVDEREQIEEARKGMKLPCAVLDGSGKSLDFDCSGYDISHFDLADGDWRHHFKSWFNAQTQAAAPQ
jgi:hypothetical protein